MEGHRLCPGADDDLLRNAKIPQPVGCGIFAFSEDSAVGFFAGRGNQRGQGNEGDDVRQHHDLIEAAGLHKAGPAGEEEARPDQQENQDVVREVAVDGLYKLQHGELPSKK